MKPPKYYLYRHLIALAFIIIIGIRFGKLTGVTIVIVIYLALNMDAIRWFWQKYLSNKR